MADPWGWDAFVVREFPMNGVRLHLRERAGRMANFVVQIGPGRDTIMRTVDAAEAAPEGMLLPDEAAEALYAELHRFFGPAPDDYKAKYEEARDALEVERRRVDELLKRLR